jgi:hypothetical protein
MKVPVPPRPRLAFAAAVLITSIELATLAAELSPRRRLVKRAKTRLVAEHVVFVVPASPRARVTIQRLPSAAPSLPAKMPSSGPATTRVAPRDSSGPGAPSSRISSPHETTPPAGNGVTEGAIAAGPVLAPRGFTPSTPLTRRVIDSVLDSLNARMPALIWARVPTPSERDAAYKESALAIRLSGRALLVPADPHLAPGLALPSLFSRRKQREAARVRTDSILAENMARVARLRERARRDSIRRDSLRRADSGATPRRPPDVRTPA